MWNVKAKMIPVILRANGTISKSLRQYMSKVPRKHEVMELPKTAVEGTAHINAESTNVKVKVMVKFPCYRPGVAQRVGRGIALLFHDRDTRRG